MHLAGAHAPQAVESAPLAATPGLPAYVRCAVLPDRRRVLVADEAGCVELWDLTSGSIVQRYGQVST